VRYIDEVEYETLFYLTTILSKHHHHIGYKEMSGRIHKAFQRVIDQKTNLASLVSFSKELGMEGLDFKIQFGCLSPKPFFQKYITEYTVVEINEKAYLQFTDLSFVEIKQLDVHQGNIYIYKYLYINTQI
jgi:hypothetical protein